MGTFLQPYPSIFGLPNFPVPSKPSLRFTPNRSALFVYPEAEAFLSFSP